MMLLSDAEAELAVISAVLVSPRSYLEAEYLRSEDFAVLTHRVIWSAVEVLAQRGGDWDVSVLRGTIEKRKELSDPVRQALLEAEAQAISASVITAHAERVFDLSRRRRTLVAVEALRQFAEDTRNDHWSEEAEQVWLRSRDVGSLRDGPVHISVALSEALADLRRVHEGGSLGVPTGVRVLDEIVQGLPLAETTVLAGKTGQGKTALALQVAEHVATNGGGVLLFSLEMHRMYLALRRLAAAAQVRQEDLTSQAGFERAMPRLSRYVTHADRWPWWVDDRAGQSISELRAKARKCKAEHPELALVVVDYLQLATGIRGQRYGNRQEEVTAVSRGLKALAGELGVAVLALSQFNRELDKEQRRPRPSDLRESGSLEQDAAMVLLLHNAERGKGPPTNDVPYELIIGKARNRQSGGYVPLWFHPAWTTFEERSESATDAKPARAAPSRRDEPPTDLWPTPDDGDDS
jgi:replicative DNA helicase